MAPRRTKSGHKRVLCPDCGKPISETYLPGHRRDQHGVRGGRSGRPRNNGHSKALVPVKARRSQPAVGFIELPYKVLVDQDGQLWLAEPLGRQS